MRARPAFTVVVLGLILAACSSGAQPQGAAPTPTAGRAGGGTGAGPGSSGEPGSSATNPAGGGSRQPTPATGPTATSPPPGSTAVSPVSPPEPGTYRYAQKGQTRAGVFTISPDPEGTLRIDAATGAAGSRRQRQLRTFSDTQSQEQVFVFRRNAVLLAELTSYFAGQQQRCEPDRPVTVVRLPLRAGESWSDVGTCDGLRMRIDAEILRREARDVGGARVPTLKIRYVVKVRGDDVTQTTRSTTWLSPAYRLIVRSVEHTTGTVQGTDFTEDRTEQLLSVTPEA